MKQILILVCFIVSISLACGGTKTSQSNAPAAPPKSVAPPVASSFSIGQDVKVGEIRWKITGAKDLGQTLKSGNQFIKDKSTSGRFVQVAFEIENQSKDLKTFAGLDMVDKQGRVYKASSDALAFIQEDARCILENINPNIVKSCQVIYEILHGIAEALKLSSLQKVENHDELDILALAIIDVLTRNGWFKPTVG